MKVLVDRHHHALLESLAILFEDRFGGEMYAPIGMDWFHAGVWQHEIKHHGDAVARQYLEGVWAGATWNGEIASIPDVRHPGRVLKGITYSGARDMQWDVVLSSLPDNDPGLATFGGKFGVQVGNNLQMSRWDLADFILSSSTLPDEGLIDSSTWGRVVTYRGKPCVIYHQEFSLETFRAEWPPAERSTVASFVNCFPETHTYPEFLALARSTPEFDFKVYGAYGTAPDDEFKAGDVSFVPDVANHMRAARTAYHSKVWSDGFGHVIHNWFSIGRPVVGYARYYADKLAGPLWVEGETSFDLEGHTDLEVADILRRLRDDDDYHRTISENAARRFRELVDFNSEADAIRGMLG